jgi:hypothetical protein
MVEDFQALRGEIVNGGRKQFRQSRLREFISNPRLSTFRQLSPTATGFHATARAPTNVVISFDEKEKSSKASLFHAQKQQRQSVLTLQSGLPGMDRFANVKEKESKKRVTIHYNDGTPKLYMRFSALNVPSPAIIVEDVKTRPQSTWYDSSSQKSRFTQSSYYFDSEKREKSDVELQPPMPKFLQGTNADPNGNRDSMNSIPSLSGPFEIVVAPQRRLSQKAAQARIYQAPTNITQAPPQAFTISQAPTIIHNVAPETMAVMAFPEPIYYPSRSESRPPTQDLDSSRIKSLTSVRSMPDSLQAVRELASQFPGPPLSGFQRSIVEEEDTSPLSVLYPPGIMAPQVLGSPSELTFRERDGQRQQTASALEVDDDVTWGNGASQFSSPIVVSQLPLSPIKAGKVPITPQGGRYRASGTPRSKGSSPNSQKPIDPFEDEDSRKSYQLSTQPINSPASKQPRRESLKVAVPATSPWIARKPSAPESQENVTPATAISGFSLFQVEQENTSGTDDPFLDLGMALDTGKSRLFKPMQPPVPVQQTPTTIKPPTTPRRFTPRDEKLSRIAEWVDSSASLAVAQMQAAAEAPTGDKSLQNLRDRGKSIDNLTIPWLPSAEMMEENERRIAHAMSSPGKPPQQPSRLKSVGKVPSRPTPAPMPAGFTRGSLHLRPIVIPPRNGNMPEAVQIEHGSLESELSVRGASGVLRDSEVLGMEDRRRNVNYF